MIALAAILGVLVGAAVCLLTQAAWYRRWVRDLRRERTAKEREAERSYRLSITLLKIANYPETPPRPRGMAEVVLLDEYSTHALDALWTAAQREQRGEALAKMGDQG